MSRKPTTPRRYGVIATATLAAEAPASWTARTYFARELLIAMLLLCASHYFVWGFAKIARWEKPNPRLTLLDFCRWDCGWYSTVIDHGYDRQPYGHEAGDAANWVFFPLFPTVASPLHRVFHIEPHVAAVVASKVMLLLAILAFMYLVRSESGDLRDVILAGSLVAFNPGVIYAHSGYAEPLYFTLAALGLAFLDRRRWIPAGIGGALLSGTRMVGITFAVAYAIAALRAGAVWRTTRERRLGVIIGALLCPVGLSALMLYMHHLTGDALASVHGYVAWGVHSGNPLLNLKHAIQDGHWMRLFAFTALAGWLCSAWLLLQRKYEQGVFLALCILLPCTAEVIGMQRFVWWQPPLFYAIFLWLKRHRSWEPIYFIFTAGMAAAMTMLWFLGSTHVV